MFKWPPGQDYLKWTKEVPNDGLIYCRGFGYSDRLLLTSPKALAEVLVTNSYDFEKPGPVRNFLRTILGDGLIIVEGDEHRFQRKNLMPVFSFRHIKDLYPIFWDKACQLTRGVAQQIAEYPGTQDDGKPSAVIEVNHVFTQVTLDIIGMAAMGRDFQALKNGQDPLIVNYEELLEPTSEKQWFFAAQIIGPATLIRRLPWKLNERVRVITTNLNNICLQLVRDKKALLKTEAEDHKDILSLLLRSNNFSDEQLVDQLLTFLAAGHETTSSAFTWTTFLLSKHPAIQSQLRAEIHAQVPSPTAPQPAGFDLATTLEAMPLLNAVCNETLRLYPTVPTTVRVAIKPTNILGQHVPAGTQVLLIPWAINRSRDLWGPDAEEFFPQRWIDTDDEGVQRPNNSGGVESNYANLTFLHGPRSCIGQGFAKAELRALIAAFVGCFEMEMGDPEEVVVPHGVVTAKPKNGMNLRLKSLGGWK